MPFKKKQTWNVAEMLHVEIAFRTQSAGLSRETCQDRIRMGDKCISEHFVIS